MLQGKVYGVYFSPTGGTRAYVTALAGLLSCEAEEIDLTAREERAVAGPAFPKMVEGLEGRLLSPRREPELYYGR